MSFTPAPATFYAEGTPVIQPHHELSHLFDEDGQARVKLPHTVVSTFFPPLTEHLAEAAGAEPHSGLTTIAGHAWEFWTAGDVGFRTLPFGAPGAVMRLESMIALGARHHIVVGAAGSLQPDLPIGSVVLPEWAIREEGTSHHYAPPEVRAEADAGLLAALDETLRAQGVEARCGAHWTTDAPYRELREKVAAFRDAGVLSVDMEVSALYVVAALRGVTCAAILAISDELHGSDWDEGFRSSRYRAALGQAGEAALAAARAATISAP